MDFRNLGTTGLKLSVIGFGAFKIGRNKSIKYPEHYELPDTESVKKILNSAVEAGINYIDTAPAYGLSEYYIGRFLCSQRQKLVISTKVGERFVDSASIYDFSDRAVTASIGKSLKNLKTDYLDIVFVHSDGNDSAIINETDIVERLLVFRDRGIIRHVGMSCKTREGIEASMTWADVVMLEYNINQPGYGDLIHCAERKGIGVVVKKGLASGHLPADASIRFVLRHPGVTSLVIASNNLEHLKSNIATAESIVDGQ
jgi:aryl-alcohol dehydrogenase-like predicted oxidoreductase